MPRIKQEKSSFIYTRTGEAVTVCAVGAITFTLMATVIGAIITFASNTVYPFSYPFIHSPLHSFIPDIALYPQIPATLFFSAIFTSSIYFFEKNIFYRRFHLALKAAFSAIAACVLVFISTLLSIICDMMGLAFLSSLFYSADVAELPILFIYYYLFSLPIFLFSDLIRRRVFALP